MGTELAVVDIDKSDFATFERDGVVLLKGVFSEWVVP